MESFYPKFGEVELVLVEDDNDFFDPLESNFECEDENEDTKLQLNDTILEENQFNLDVDDDDDDEEERDASSSPVHSGSGGKPRIKREISDQNCDYTDRPIIAPKFECDVDASEDSFDANNSHFYDNDDDNDPNYEDNTPTEAKPDVDDLSLQSRKTSSTQPKTRSKESMVSIPGKSSSEVRDVKQSVADKKVNLKKTTKNDGDVKAKTKRKPRAKTKTATATDASTPTTTVIATATATASATATATATTTNAEAEATNTTGADVDAVAAAAAAIRSKQERSHRKVKVSTNQMNLQLLQPHTQSFFIVE